MQYERVGAVPPVLLLVVHADAAVDAADVVATGAPADHDIDLVLLAIGHVVVVTLAAFARLLLRLSTRS